MTLLARIHERDRALYHQILLSPNRSPRSRMLAIALTHLGGARATVALTLIPLLLDERTRLLGRHALLSLALSHLVVQLVKRTVGRPRPSSGGAGEVWIAEPDHFSFPSGHATAALAVALAYAAFFPALAVPIIALAAVIGASRVVLGVHYPGDVAAGQSIALATHLILMRCGV